MLPTLTFSDATYEGFDKLVVGAKAEETKKVELTISDFAENEELQGKTVELEIEILDVKRVEEKSPEEVAESLGIESVEELRNLIRQSMEELSLIHI